MDEIMVPKEPGPSTWDIFEAVLAIPEAEGETLRARVLKGLSSAREVLSGSLSLLRLAESEQDQRKKFEMEVKAMDAVRRIANFDVWDALESYYCYRSVAHVRSLQILAASAGGMPKRKRSLWSRLFRRGRR